MHLAILNGTNLAPMNALVHELIERDYVDRASVAARTVGFDQLAEVVADVTPERAAGEYSIDADDIRRAAEIFGT